MNVEVLVVPECPNTDAAIALLEAVAPQQAVRITVVATEAEAYRRSFTGSPTFLLDSVDPFADENAQVGLSCRLYATADGLRGVPTLDAMRSALGG